MRYTVRDPSPLFVSEPEQVGAYDAKTRLAELLAAVEGGASYVITRHGRPVARLLPVMPAEPARDVADALLAERAGRRLGAPLRTLIQEGRR
jgi:prevent-host-death family protein